LTNKAQDSEQDLVPEAADAGRRTSIETKTARRRNVGKAVTVDTRVQCFVVRNAPMRKVVYCLKAIGIQIGWEAVYGEPHYYVDEDGTTAYSANRLISIDLGRDPTVRDILDGICEADPKYVWSCDDKGQLVNLVPKNRSRLDFLIGPVTDKGNPCDVLRRIASQEETSILKCSGSGLHLPNIDIATKRVSARTLLNEMVKEKPGLRWCFGYCYGPTIVEPTWNVSFDYFPTPAYKGVRLEFPTLGRGEYVYTGWYYASRERDADRIAEITLVKRKYQTQWVPRVDKPPRY